MKKKRLNLPILSSVLVILLMLVNSCGKIPPLSKKNYIKNFSTFVTEVGMKYESYTDEDWAESDSTFKRYSVKYYERFREKLSPEEQTIVSELKGKYLGYRFRGKTGSLLDDLTSKFKDIIDQSRGFIDGVTGEPDTAEGK